MQPYTVYLYLETVYMFRVVLESIIKSAYNCIYSIWYLSHCYCYLPLSWKSWNRFECAVGGVRLVDIPVSSYLSLVCSDSFFFLVVGLFEYVDWLGGMMDD
jgi:hypothetical protein